MSAILYFLLTVVILMSVTSAAKSKGKVGDYFPLCSRTDPKLGECIKNSMLKAKPDLIKGIPDLQLVPMDPLNIPRLEFKDGQGNFELQMTLKNLVIKGLKDINIEDCKMDYDKRHLDMEFSVPFMTFEAQYEIAGKILVIPIQGNGDVVFNFTGVRTVAAVQSTPMEKNGELYHPIEEFKWSISVDNAQSHFTNLFNGDKALGESTNKFLNENSKEAFETIKALPEEAFGQFFKEIGNKIFTQYPVDELYLK